MTELEDTGLVNERAIQELVADFRDVAADEVVVVRLTGGVSAAVFRVIVGTDAMVVKQSRAILDVPWFWAADPGRSAFEADALEIYGAMTPGQVPRVLEYLGDQHIIVMEAAPLNWSNFKVALLAGRAPAEVSAVIGRTLATWHGQTLDDASIRDRFTRSIDLDELRIQPYFTASVANRPELSELMAEASEVLRRPGRCLVHGDATPKNVLFSPDGAQAWLLDPEVAHFGQPEFDIAMWSSHLLLKMQRNRPGRTIAGQALHDFVDSYRMSAPVDLVNEDAVGLLVTAVIQARLHGLSRVDYIEGIDMSGLEQALTRIEADREASLEVLSEIGGDVA